MKKYASALLPFAILAILTASGSLDWPEHQFQDMRFRLVQRDASDQIVLVEIDEPSLRTLGVWPWPRTYHAEAVNRLLDAGAATIALDVDLSAQSTPEADQALEDALRRAGRRAVLPVFEQPARQGLAVAELFATAPLQRFARYASLASVVVHPDSDSRIRQVNAVETHAGGMLPSMAVALGGNARTVPMSFTIDYGIRPDSITRIAFADVMRGRFAPELVRGRHVLIGATAVQLGDQLAVPLHVSLPGTTVVMLAAQSLFLDRALTGTGLFPTLAGCLLLLLVLWGPMGSWDLSRSAAVAAAASGTMLCMSIAAQAALPVIPLTMPALLTPWLGFLHSVLAAFEQQTVRLFRQRMEARQRNMIAQQIVANAFEAIVVVDHNGDVLIHNAAAERLFCRENESLVGRPAQSLLRVIADEAGTRVPILALIDGEEAHGRLLEGVAVNGWGDDVPVELSIRRMLIQPENHRLERRKQARTFHFISARDVSERRRAESALRLALHNAEAASDAKSRFLATISHELRTPLNAVIGFSDMITEQSFGPIGDVRYREYARDINSSGRHLLGLINDILDVTCLESGSVPVAESEIDLAACIATTLRLLAPQTAAAKLEVRVDAKSMPRLIADPRLIQQVLVNLVSNAIKFTPAGGTVMVAAVTRPDRGIALRVSDTGVGIAAGELAKLGQPFYQTDQSHTRKFGGAGLGLSIVRGLVELHGGTFSITSKLGAGTTVACDFPPSRTAGGATVAA